MLHKNSKYQPDIVETQIVSVWTQYTHTHTHTTNHCNLHTCERQCKSLVSLHDVNQISLVNFTTTQFFKSFQGICNAHCCSPAVVQTHSASLQHVHQSAWSGHQEVTATLKVSDLTTNISTTIYHTGTHMRAIGKLPPFIINL